VRNFVYKYGLQAPTAGAFQVDRQLKLAFEYHKKLIEIEVSRRKQVDELLATSGLSGYTDTRGQAELHLAAVLADLGKARSATQSRSETPEQRDAIKAARTALKAAWAAEKTARSLLFKEAAVKETIVEIGARHLTWAKAARAACNCYWGTYLLVEQSVDQARKAPTPPSFPRWTGEGTVAVQIQGGLGCAEIFTPNTRFYLDPVPASAWDRRRSPEQRTVAHLRVSSDSTGKPIWATWPVTLHRPVPPNSRVKWAKVKVSRLAGKPSWSLCLSLETPEQIVVPGNRLLAVDLGWRGKPASLRGGFFVGSDGDLGEIGVDIPIQERLQKVSDLQSIRKKNFNEVQKSLIAWISVHKIPAWMADLGIAYVHLWKATGHLVILIRAWREARFPDDDEGFTLLDTWEKQDYHLWQWQENLRDKVLRRRREVYRVAAARLAEQYNTLILEDFDLSKMQRHIAPEAEEVERPAARLQQRIAAPSELRLCLINAFTMRGKTVVKLDPAYTTQECHLCGHTEKWDAAASVDHVCPGCGACWDQDENAARVLLIHYGSEREGVATPNGKATANNSKELQKSGSKWSRLKKTRSQSEAESLAVPGIP
jgi:hypothetical protein